MINLILCGGSGTRLWPISRTMFPKQFVKIFNDKSLFELTLKRNSNLCDEIYIISNEQLYFICQDQLESANLQSDKFLLEPIARNTAPAIALACLSIKPDEMVLVTPSDHLIKDENAYENAIKQAQIYANSGAMVLFGIKPTSANTGYGYIKSDGENVVGFYEKPDEKLANEFLKDEKFDWNSGMFMFKAGVFLKELKLYAPKIYEACLMAHENSIKNGNCDRIKFEDMQQIPQDSIDYAVMEKTKNIKIVHCDIGWSDLGSFDSLSDELSTNKIDESHICVNSKNNFIYGTSRKIATIDIENCIIIDTKDALLICKKGSSQKVKEIVKNLGDSELASTHLKTYRPWGYYTILENSKNYKIKRIVVKPGKRLSLQKHFHRNEHWIVVSGTATVTIDGNVKLLRPNESTYIKMGEIHRLANEGKIPVVLIEAQIGEYTGEDDIIRIEDDFLRK